ncbi:glycoside hydrolase [Thozetella sp. PMI_491]|nr:glycoside hydrolase [Thozetella sp. PMI_491]
MHFRPLALAAWCAIPALAKITTPSVNLYWGQLNGLTLDEYCAQPGFEYITVSFVVNSPEEDTSGLGYPGMNIDGGCHNATVYFNATTGKPSRLLKGCTEIETGIPACQKLGRKVLLSIGGQEAYGNYTVSTAERGVQFAEFMWGAFGPVNSSWTGPRPFGSSVIDGFDFDLEYPSGMEGYVAMITRLRELITASASPDSYVITGAPLCALETTDYYRFMAELIGNATFDAIWVQFYNSPGCDWTSGKGLNYDDWESYLQKGASKDAKIFIGLLGDSVNASSTGYINAPDAYQVVTKYRSRPSFGGVMVWDAITGSNSTGNPKNLTYYQVLHDAAQGVALSFNSSGFSVIRSSSAPTAALASALVGLICIILL